MAYRKTLEVALRVEFAVKGGNLRSVIARVSVPAIQAQVDSGGPWAV